MFTPPPSPLPVRPTASTADEPEPIFLEEEERHASSHATKRLIGRRFRMAVILIPLLVILITARIGYATSRSGQTSAGSVLPAPWHGLDSSSRFNKRQPEPDPQPQGLSLSPLPTGTSTSAPPTPTGTPISQQPIPTVPSAPPTLPTPFPQTFDAGIAQNFSSISCSNFFSNMTTSAPYRQCRPFSVLLENSAAFVNAQTNLTLMNSIIWGTCNTVPGRTQCEANMSWFEDALQTSCPQELKNNNALVTNSLKALRAFSVMYDVACQADPTSNTYCYLNAVRNSNPADSYYYGLPLGISVPTSATPTCSTCSKSVMGVYAAALKDPSKAAELSALQSTYDATAKLTKQYCGADFVDASVGSAALPSLTRPSWVVTGGLAILFSLMLHYAS